MTGIHSPAQQARHQSSRVAISHALPALNGKKFVVSVVEVTYGPGEASTSHSHPCLVIAYVAEGEIRSRDRAHTHSDARNEPWLSTYSPATYNSVA
jgi:quercetin dioxygenase-like cupin family protein